MPVEIPFRDLPSWIEEVTLDNVPYILKFVWNSRGSYWTIGFYNLEQNPLILGIKMIIAYELISRYPDRDLPPGELYVVDPTLNYEKPGRNDFTGDQPRLSLLYIEEDEIASFQ